MRKGVDKAMVNSYACTAQHSTAQHSTAQHSTAQLRLILPFSLVNTKSKKVRRILPALWGGMRLFALPESVVIPCE